MPYQLAIRVGAASSAAQPARRLTTSFWPTVDHRQVHRHRRGQQFAHRVGRIADARGVIEHVAQIRAHFLADQVAVEAHELVEDVLHRRHRETQRHQFALEQVQALDRLRD